MEKRKQTIKILSRRKQVIKILQHLIKVLKEEDIFLDEEFVPTYIDDGELISESRVEEYLNKQIIKIKTVLQ